MNKVKILFVLLFCLISTKEMMTQIVRFQTAGKHDLPLSSVRVNGKEYRTPPMSVWVQPAIANIEGVECSFGYTKKNIQLLREAIENKVN